MLVEQKLTEHLRTHLVLKPRGSRRLVRNHIDTTGSSYQVGQIRCTSRCTPLNSHWTQSILRFQCCHRGNWTDIPSSCACKVRENLFGSCSWLGKISLDCTKRQVQSLSWLIVLKKCIDGRKDIVSEKE
ncbi:hypothetical protein GCK72_019085 [Caenorhabditis remanei]|uniref:Uncharacterized protein n=1 Tax=Caenorhabditis remanei TaxID=31234 RepID=A0A6A5GBR4_CAERE|nr:hypothetical protein GCK72_019085 [Caenorhabditis remanei]KAF1752530.1 hypothetical protein GCK72_019085 [Caenorhabditis remanei]